MNLTSKFPVLSTGCMGRFGSCFTHCFFSPPKPWKSEKCCRIIAGNRENSGRWDLTFFSPLEHCRFRRRAQNTEFVWFAKPFLDCLGHPEHGGLHPNVRTGSSEKKLWKAPCFAHTRQLLRVSCTTTAQRPDCFFSSPVAGLKTKLKVTAWQSWNQIFQMLALTTSSLAKCFHP